MSEYLIEVNVTESKQYEGEVIIPDLQQAVGGIIEVIHLQDSIMIVNEEGLIKELPYNILASGIAGMPIVGNAVLLTHESMRKLTW